MQVSEARVAANRRNSTLSTGPRTYEGKLKSRMNGVTHALTARVAPATDGDREEIARRAGSLEADLKPTTEAGRILIAQMATLSVRAERAAEHETAAIARDVRHAADDFDEARIHEAEGLLEQLDEDPRTTLRKLRKSPEGVDLLIETWQELRNDLGAEPAPVWTDVELERAANLIGLKSRHALGSRFGALTRGFRGDFAALSDADGGGLDDEARRAWAFSALVDAIDAEMAGLEQHYQTLDFETIAVDRAEAGSRALFDSSKPANLARRYEAEARRGFFKALKEFRQVEAESAARAEVEAVGHPAPPLSAGMGSLRERPDRMIPESTNANSDGTTRGCEVIQDGGTTPLAFNPLLKSTR